jgi:hypothetical protein
MYERFGSGGETVDVRFNRSWYGRHECSVEEGIDDAAGSHEDRGITTKMLMLGRSTSEEHSQCRGHKIKARREEMFGPPQRKRIEKATKEAASTIASPADSIEPPRPKRIEFLSRAQVPEGKVSLCCESG